MIPYLEDVLGICQQFARNGVSPAFTLFDSVTPSNSRADEVVTESEQVSPEHKLNLPLS